MSAPALTAQDREDARFSLALGVDYLALSFVRHASDILELRALIAESGSGADTEIIAKIEKPEALVEIEAILDAADGIMVARGDLGVELPAESVPFIQSELIDRARARCKPVIVATQMLESMIGNPRPTRAEVSDVSTAVMAGADAVMLSAETASGAFPVQAVATMDRAPARPKPICGATALSSRSSMARPGRRPFRSPRPSPKRPHNSRATCRCGRSSWRPTWATVPAACRPGVRQRRSLPCHPSCARCVACVCCGAWFPAR